MTALDEIERIREDLAADDTYAEYGGRDIGILLAEIDRLRSLQGESPSTGTTSELVAQRPQGSASESPALLTSKDVDIPEIYAWVRAQFGGHFPSMDEIARAFYERCAAETPVAQCEPYLKALTRYIDGVYSMAMEYRVPAKDAAFHAKHMQDAVLGLRRILSLPDSAVKTEGPQS